MTDHQAIERTILDICSEDEYGLWEILWRIRTVYPQLELETARALAANAVIELNANGYVTIEERTPERSIAVTGGAVRNLVAAPGPWAEPTAGAVTYWAFATEQGRQRYLHLARA